MDADIYRLITLLDEETAAYQSMETVLEEEYELSALSGRERLEAVESRKARLIARIRDLEQKRARLVGQVARRHGAENPSITVRQLGRMLPAVERDRLLSRANALRTLIDAIRTKNRRNRKLIHQYLVLIDGALKLFARVIDDDAVYSKSGDDRPSSGYRRNGGRIFCGNA